MVHHLHHLHMYFVFQEFQRSLGDGQYLAGTTAFLERTSSMIDLFSDVRPILGANDPRLMKIQEAAAWFIALEDAVEKSAHQQKKRGMHSLIIEIRDDTMLSLF